jgi:hypothetical protein
MVSNIFKRTSTFPRCQDCGREFKSTSQYTYRRGKIVCRKVAPCADRERTARAAKTITVGGAA